MVATFDSVAGREGASINEERLVRSNTYQVSSGCRADGLG